MADQLLLRPCPFCGDEAVINRVGTRWVSCIVTCTGCGGSHESSDEGARSGTAWNRRTEVAAVMRTINKLDSLKEWQKLDIAAAIQGRGNG